MTKGQKRTLTVITVCVLLISTTVFHWLPSGVFSSAWLFLAYLVTCIAWISSAAFTLIITVSGLFKLANDWEES